MQNLVEFVTEKGGGVLFIAGELFNPLSYRGTPLELLLPIELADARNPTAVGTERDVVPPRADARRAAPARSSASATTKWRACRSGRSCPSSSGTSRPRARSPRRWCWPNIPTVDRLRRQAAADRLPVRRRRQVDVPRVRRHLALAVPRRRQVSSAGSGSRRSASWPDRDWSASARPRSRPTAAAISGASRSSSASGSPTPAWRRPASDVTIQVERKGQGPRKLALKLVPGTKNVFEGACRRPPRASTRSGSCRRPCSTGRSRPSSASSRRSTSASASR